MKNDSFSKSRRNFLKSSLALPIAVATAPSLLTGTAFAEVQAGINAEADALPRRQLGKGGPQVTMLTLGGMMAAMSPD